MGSLYHRFLTFALLLFFALSADLAFAQFGPVQVETVAAKEMSIRDGITLVGETRPLRTSIIGAEVEGQVNDLKFEEGQIVRKGEILAQLDSEILEIQLASARALLSLRQAELEELKNGSRPEEIERARSEVASAQADREYWLWQVDQTKELFNQKVSSEEALQDAQRSLKRAEMAQKVAQAALDLAVEGPRKERITQAQSQVEVQKQEIRRLEDNIGRHAVKAPFDGVITQKPIEVGEWIDKGDNIATLIDLSKFEVEVQVPEYQIVGVHRGDEATARLAAVPGRFFKGEVAVVIPQADPNSRTFPVRLRIENPIEADMPLVKSGMFASVTLASGPQTTAVLVPKDALVLGGKVPSVYVATPDVQNPTSTVAQMVTVDLGSSEEGWIQVKGDVKPGDPVIVYGNERLRPGQAVLPSPRVSAAHAQASPGKNDQG